MKPPWYNGSVLDFGTKSCGFESHCRHFFMFSNRSFYANLGLILFKKVSILQFRQLLSSRASYG